MDKLDDLPTKEDANISPQEKMLISRFFGKGDADSGSASSSGSGKKNKWKFMGYVMVAFVLLANPWVDKIFDMVPKCDSSITKLAMKALIFFIALYFIHMYQS